MNASTASDLAHADVLDQLAALGDVGPDRTEVGAIGLEWRSA